MPPELIEQRIRNRLIEFLELATSEHHVLRTFGLNEIVNQWFDWNPDEPTVNDYPKPPYTESEAQLLYKVAIAISAFVNATSNDISDFSAAVATSYWRDFASCSNDALKELMKRGKLSENA
jgi:hypothetical protein